MAKMSLNQRFPHFGLILLLAVLLAIPLTVWSLNNVPTNTQQEAFIPPTDGGCGSSCVSTAPTNLVGYLKNCVKTSYGTTTGTLYLSWNKVTNATGYKIKVHNSIQSIDLTSSTNYYSTSKYSYATGYKLYWQVWGYNKYSTGPKSADLEIKCR